MIKNTPIEELIEQYEYEGNDFSDVKWLLRSAYKYANTLQDSQVRCLLYALANEVEKNGV